MILENWGKTGIIRTLGGFKSLKEVIATGDRSADIDGNMSGRVIVTGNEKTVSQDRQQSLCDRVIISYCHRDKIWLERLQTMLRPLVWNDKISVWDDTKIRPGAKWREEIEHELSLGKVAVLLVSPDFLASDFITKHELPSLIKGSGNRNLTIIWVLLRACFYDKTEIVHYQAAHDISKPLDTLPPGKRSQEIYNICKKIDEALAN
jgi:hypothetical protein